MHFPNQLFQFSKGLMTNIDTKFGNNRQGVTHKSNFM